MAEVATRVIVTDCCLLLQVFFLIHFMLIPDWLLLSKTK